MEGTVAIEKCGPPRTDNLQESEISGVLLQARYQLAKAWLENNPYPFRCLPCLPVPSQLQTHSLESKLQGKVAFLKHTGT